MLSNKTRYAIKALMLLALQPEGNSRPMLISELVKQGNLPQKFLEAILLELKRQGILDSKKGKGGGYFLAKPTSDIMLGHVVRLLEGPIALLPCVSQMAYQKCEECVNEATCSVRFVFKRVRDVSAGILDQTSLADLVNIESKLSDQVPMYFI